MWSSKMAARWRGADGPLNAGNSDFLASNTPIKLVLSRRAVDRVEMDTQSCMDHSILAIFEDSSVASEDKSGVEEESETLLSALTEMLDSVEDDDGTPFDTLPDTKLLSLPENRSTVEPSLADRLRPRSKSLNITHTIKADGEKEEDQLLKQQSQSLLHSKSKKAEVEVEVFTSTSLVNLVKLMHPYCLKLHVEEEGGKLRKKSPALLSQGEVWKYERPCDESDEEINVVSDDEVTMKDTKGGDEKRNDDRLLKSVLLNGNTSRTPPSREKKRVSFGPVQVASFESAEKGLNERDLSGHTSDAGSVPLNSTKAPEDPARSALEPQTVSSELSSNQVLPLKGETKVKALSLQQYRQLRQKRQPLVEKRGNYTTKWPCVSEPPKELTPILCLQGQRPKAAPHCPDSRRSSAGQLHRSLTPGHRTLHTSTLPGLHLSEAHPGTPLRRGGLKRLRTESGISPASLHPANPNVTVPESKKSPVKKPALLSTDPPNPVLLPLSVSQTASSPTTGHSSAESKAVFPSRDSSSTRHFPEIPNQSSGTSLQRQPSSSGSKPEVVLVNQGSTTLIKEIQSKFTVTASGVCSRPPALCSTTHKTSTERCSPNLVREEARLEPDTPLPLSPDKVKHPSLKPHLSHPPASVAAPIPVKEVQPSISTSEEPAADSGIEAPDLTSLLEQFEETQAKEERVCENEPEPIFATLPSNLQRGGHFDRTKPAGTQRASEEALQPLSTSESPADSETLRNSLCPQMSGGSDIPEPLGTEVVLSTQQDLPARRRNPPSKAIQIIDPRPLPSKRTHTNLPELPTTPASPHMCSSVSSDHDYCGTIDRSLTGAAQLSRASELRDVCQTSDKPQVTALDLPPAAECRKQTSACEANITIRAVDKSATQHLSEQPQTRLETGPLKEVASDGGAIDRDCVHAAPCALPTPPPSPPARARDKRRHQRRSPRSDSSSCSPSSSSSSSSSSSASPSPERKKHRHKRSESSSRSSSSPSRSVSRSPPRRYRWSYSRSRRSRSRSRSWSQSRSPSRSPSPRVCHRQWRNVYRNRESRKLRREHEIRIQKLKAIDERRVVYVGRIRKSMTHDELRERFSQFGEVECVSLHFRDRGDHYGFVTFYNMDDAFAAIDNGGKLRRPDELPFDICFGGRRQFCNSHYADLDANREAEPTPAKSRFEDLDFDSLLKQAQRGIKR